MVEYQRVALRRSVDHVLTAEDVIVHKLIAWRLRDRDDIRSILEAAGAELADVVKVSVYMTDMRDFAAMNEAYAGFFPAADGPPARITLEVAGLALSAKVEIECIAAKRVG